MKRTGFSVGDTLTLSNGAATNSYVVVGSFKSRATDVEAVIPSTYAVSDFGKAIIMVTHSPEAAKSSSRIITVRDGVIE